jgi:hypothetical protein
MSRDDRLYVFRNECRPAPALRLGRRQRRKRTTGQMTELLPCRTPLSNQSRVSNQTTNRYKESLHPRIEAQQQHATPPGSGHNIDDGRHTHERTTTTTTDTTSRTHSDNTDTDRCSSTTFIFTPTTPLSRRFAVRREGRRAGEQKHAGQ